MQLFAEKMELGRELQRANDGIAELVNQRLRDKELMEKIMENARGSNKVLREKMECVQEQLVEMERRERVSSTEFISGQGIRRIPEGGEQEA